MSHTPFSTPNRVLAALGVVLILATGAVFATTSSSGAPAAAKAPVAAVDHVRISDFKFAPVAISVAVGTTITWTNEDDAPHTATSGDSPSPDDVFDTDIIKKGQSRTVKVTTKGTFQYYCALHPFMQATVTVR
jgi:plastocyanin